MQIVSVEQSLRNIIYISWTERLLRPVPKRQAATMSMRSFTVRDRLIPCFTLTRALTFIDRLPLEAGCEGYVIQGRCANFAFQGRDDVVSVFLTANDAFCVDTVADTHGVSARKAKTVVRETNDNRKTYHKYYTGQEWGQAENYDLCLNVAKLGVDGVIAMIDSFIQNRK